MSKAQIDALQEMLDRAPTPEASVTEQKAHQDLELSDIQYQPLSWFKPHPLNEIFRSLKTQQYWTNLERDVREAGLVKSPAIAMKDGKLIEGESRLKICEKLNQEGVFGFDVMPVRIVLSPLSRDKQKRLVYLGNLSRFNIPDEKRILLYAEIWPGYFDSSRSKGGRPKKGEQSSPFLQTAAQVAASLGKTERHVQKMKATYQKAKEHARKQGRKSPSESDIRAASKPQAQQAKKPAGASKPASRPGGIVVGFTSAEAEETLTALSVKPTGLRRQIIAKIRKAKSAQLRR